MLTNLDDAVQTKAATHEQLVAYRGYNSVSLYNLVHLPVPIPEANDNAGSKGGSGQGMGQLKKCQPGKNPMQETKKGIGEALKQG